MKWFIFKESDKKAEPPDKEEIVECADCGHLIRKDVAQEVTKEEFLWDFLSRYPETTIYYCPAHQKKYTRILVQPEYHKKKGVYGLVFPVTRYYKPRDPWQEVDKTGKEIK